MDVFSIDTGFFKLDGGAMFGVVPKSIWSKSIPADENNLCTWAMRCLLVKKDDRIVLIDTGIGNKQSEKFFSYYYLHGNDTLLGSLANVGVKPEEVTDVFFTHLHFDHCGGAVKQNSDKTGYALVFKNATHWSHSKHWEWATHPNNRERASFLKENILPIEESGQLKFADKENFDVFDYILVNGHTAAQMLPKIKYQSKTLVYVADLLPSVAHIPLPYVMGYDTRPLLTLKEKEQLLNEALEKKYLLVFEHDAKIESCTLKVSNKRPVLDKTYALKDYFNEII